MKDERDIFQKLDGHEEAPSAQAWGKLERRLGPDRSRKAIIWRVAAALLVVVVGTGAYYTSFRKEEGATVARVERKVNGTPTETQPKNLPDTQPAMGDSQAAQTRVAAANDTKNQQETDASHSIASIEPAKPSTQHLPQSRPRTVDVDKILEGTAKGSRKANATQAQVAVAEKKSRKEGNRNEVRTAAQPYREMVAQNDEKLEFGVKNEVRSQTQPKKQQAPAPAVASTPIQQNLPAQVATNEAPVKAEANPEAVAFTMELHPTRLAAVDQEEESDPNRPLFGRLVKSASDLAKGKVNLKSRGTAALNNFFGRKSAEPETDKDNN
jgi:hypothetical protein